jgi:HSP20 family protein
MELNKLAVKKDNRAWDPWYRLVDDVFDMRSSLDFPGFGTGWIPAVDVEETKDEYQIRAEMPGLKKEDVKISLTENVLTIAGEKKLESRTDKKKYHRLERTYGSFQRSFSLPAPIQPDKITAAFKDGILEVKVPKSEEAKPKEIDIKVG